MKNFARLLRFAWPYRVRFALSLACAMMVALFWGGNIGAVYPLLQILTRSENCQSWISEQIDTSRTESQALAARIEELDAIGDLGVGLDAKQARVVRASAAYDQALRRRSALRRASREQGGVAPAPGRCTTTQGDRRTRPEEGSRRPEGSGAASRQGPARGGQVAVDLARPGGYSELDVSQDSPRARPEQGRLVELRYRKVQPFVNNYLPGNGFRTLVLLLSLVMVGIA